MVKYVEKLNARRIFINGFKGDQLDFKTISSLFKRFGEITAITLMQRNREDDQIFHFGFVTFRDQKSADNCLEETKDGIEIEQGTLVFTQLARSVAGKRVHYRRFNQKRRNEERGNYRNKTKRTQNQEKEDNEQTLEQEQEENQTAIETGDSDVTPQMSRTEEHNTEELNGSDTDFFDCY